MEDDEERFSESGLDALTGLLKVFVYARDQEKTVDLMTEDFELYGASAVEHAGDKQETIALFAGDCTATRHTRVLDKVDMKETAISDGVSSYYGKILIQDVADGTYIGYRATAICVKEKTGWKVKQLHLSVPLVSDLPSEHPTVTISKEKIRQMGEQISTELINDRLPVAVVSISNDEKKSVLRMSRSLIDQLGYEDEHEFEMFTNRSIYNMLCPEDIPMVREFFFSSIKDSTGSFVCRLRKKDFTYLWMEVHARHTVDSEGQNITVCACVDLNDSIMSKGGDHLGENDARDLLADLETLVDSVPGGVHKCMLGDAAKVLYVSDTLCQMVGYSMQDIREKFDSRFSMLIVEEDREIFRAAIRELKEYPHTLKIRYRFRTRNGNIKPVCDMIRSVRHTDGVMYAYAIVTDDYVEERNGTPSGTNVFVKTFGFFDVFVNDQPIPFQYSKSRELLALLVDRKGGFVDSREIISYLWEDDPVNQTTLSRCRKTVMRLMNELKRYGIEYIVESAGNGKRRIVPEKINCDLYDYLDGTEETGHRFAGSYMTNYSWAEYTLAELEKMDWTDMPR